MKDTYRWRGGTEMLLRQGTGSSITLLVLPALFEEANRMRRFTVTVMRALAERGIGTILPDLPGTGESEVSLSSVTYQDWHNAVSAFAPAVFGSIAFRGGALLDDVFDNRWRLAPETGERILRDMVRATAFSEGKSATDLDQQAQSTTTRLAGNLIGPALYTALSKVVPIDGSQEAVVEGLKLWRAAEPGDDQDFAQQVADNITAWIKTCGA